MRLAEFERLQGYLLVYGGLACLLTFWLLPGLVAATTHVRRGELIRSSQEALVTAFVTSNLFVVLPQIVENARTLLAAGGPDDETEAELVEVLVPTSFNFPHSAKLLSLSFVPFVAWYSGLGLDLSFYPTLAGAGLLAVFGSINTAIPFLLDLAHLPGDLFQLFVVSGVLNSRFGSMAATMHTLTIAILGTCLISGRVAIDRARLARYFGASVLMVAAFLAGHAAPARGGAAESRHARGGAGRRSSRAGRSRPPRSSPSRSCRAAARRAARGSTSSAPRAASASASIPTRSRGRS
jgi:Na+/H+-dicarboxylate symporter